ncbi:hypothetical protein DEH18_33305 [Streptomyces sp. NHF165]|uniref:hypothetical protein n=1 Tax=Streptomyces sp. NHF165 TaxID=2175864 RepID=UPI00132F1A22|nr:hypothetical protein [Streptomyces sp. NHF165]QHF97909.1 hypothetical protein DEH18_33305 [Streptomyces sp. NHF165]
MIRPQLTADGRAVHLADDRPELLLDDLATAYAADPDTVGALLAHLAERVDSRDAALCPLTPEHIRAMRAAEADAAREALLDELPAGAPEHILSPREAVALADALTARAHLANQEHHA